MKSGGCDAEKESLPRLLEEKKQLEAARTEVAKLPVGGPYELPKKLDISAARPAPGQKDLFGTMGEIAELKHPGEFAAQLEGPAKNVRMIAGK